MVRALASSRGLFCMLLYFALAVQTYRYVSGASFYGEYLHWTGKQSVRLLIAAMAVTPLRLLFPRAGWVKWLLRCRRVIGVAAFFYATAHTIVYLQNQEGIESIVRAGLTFEILTGWLAFTVMFILAATSNDLSVRVLEGKWKALHRTVFFCAALALLHWILTAFNPMVAYLHLATFLALLVWRKVAHSKLNLT